MLYRPSDLSPDAAERLESHATDLERRLLDRVEALLLDLPSEAAGQFVYDLAFKPSEVLPKRQRRPKLDSALLAEQVYLEHDPSGTDLDPVLDVAVVVQEYFDMLDDAVDGDVAAGHTGEVILATQFLLPLALRRLDDLGATRVWADGVLDLLEAPLAEGRREPSPEAYEELLASQATLYASMGEIAALAAGADDEAVERAGAVGAAIYEHRQVLLDHEQYVLTDDEGWNAGALFGPDGVEALLRDRREAVRERTSTFDGERAELLRGLVALDVDEWRESLEKETR